MAVRASAEPPGRLLVSLLVLNHLLMVSGGAALAVAACAGLNLHLLGKALQEYRPVVVLLCIFASFMFALALVVVAAICFASSGRRTILLYTYAALMAALVCAEAAAAGWLAWRVTNSVVDYAGSLASSAAGNIASGVLSKVSGGYLGNAEPFHIKTHTQNVAVTVLWAVTSGAAQLAGAVLAAVAAYRQRSASAV